MEVMLTHVGGTAVLVVTGRVDAFTAPAFERQMLATAGEPIGLVLDLSATTYIASAGLRTILMTARLFARRSARFAVCVPPGGPRELIERTGLDQVLDLHETRRSALSAVMDQRRRARGTAEPLGTSDGGTG